jgi:hypothetical protein
MKCGCVKHTCKYIFKLISVGMKYVCVKNTCTYENQEVVSSKHELETKAHHHDQ